MRDLNELAGNPANVAGSHSPSTKHLARPRDPGLRHPLSLPVAWPPARRSAPRPSRQRQQHAARLLADAAGSRKPALSGGVGVDRRLLVAVQRRPLSGGQAQVRHQLTHLGVAFPLECDRCLKFLTCRCCAHRQSGAVRGSPLSPPVYRPPRSPPLILVAQLPVDRLRRPTHGRSLSSSGRPLPVPPVGERPASCCVARLAPHSPRRRSPGRPTPARCSQRRRKPRRAPSGRTCHVCPAARTRRPDVDTHRVIHGGAQRLIDAVNHALDAVGGWMLLGCGPAQWNGPSSPPPSTSPRPRADPGIELVSTTVTLTLHVAPAG